MYCDEHRIYRDREGATWTNNNNAGFAPSPQGEQNGGSVPNVEPVPEPSPEFQAPPPEATPS